VTARHVYIHVPFCARRCTYCDFSIAVRKTTPVREYLDALAREAALADLPRSPKTIYLGGGTPSRLGGEGIARLAGIILGQSLPLSHSPTLPPVYEFTIEANPDDVTESAARAWVAAGINRVSLGAQSFDERVLQWMHRTHDVPAIASAVRTLRAAGIANLSLDLIFALPEQLERDWRADLEQATRLEPDHVSLYGLTVEQSTPLARQIARADIAAAPDSRWEEEYLLAHERLGEAGFRFYELSNAARSGREAVHNRAYWTLAPYLGLGPSAHSFDGTSRWWNQAAYARWSRLLGEGQSPIAGREILSEAQRGMERLYLGLRTDEGVELKGAHAVKARDWIRQGWAIEEGARREARVGDDRVQGGSLKVRLTAEGWLRLDELVVSL
jgi:oxygen-independent coproporphyrinogen-3 oxidase